MNKLRLHTVSPVSCRVLINSGLHIGNLKLIGGVWKFKAVGYNELGYVIPGGGPLTGRHNTTFAALDESAISRALGSNFLF